MKLPKSFHKKYPQEMNPTENNTGHYVRVRYDSENPVGLAEIFLKKTLPLIMHIGHKFEDERAHYGEFTNIRAVTIYNKNVILTKGEIGFRGKVYGGLEFLSNRSIDIKKEAQEFIQSINQITPGTIKNYKITSVKKI